MKKIVILMLLCFSNLVLYAQSITSEEREIIEIQNSREMGNQKLLSYLTHPNEKIRCRALVAIANIEDTTAIRNVMERLSDEKPEVRAMAIFALSYIGVDTVSVPLFNMLLRETDTNVQKSILNTLGFIGSASILDSLTEMNANLIKRELRDELALCYGRYAQRGIRTERSVWQCFSLLEDTSATVQSKALYALWCLAPYEMIDVEIAKHDELLISLAHHPNPYVRMNLAMLLSRAHGMYRAAILDSLELYEFRTTNDWRVLVQVVKARAAQVTDDRDNFSRLANYIHHFQPYVQVTAVQNLAQIPTSVIIASGLADVVAKELTAMALDTTYSEMLRGEALVTLGKLFPYYFDNNDSLWLSIPSVAIQRKRLEAIGQNISQRHLDTLIAHLTDPNIKIAMAAWDYSRNFATFQALQALKYDSARAMTLFGAFCDKAEYTMKRGDIALTTIVADIAASPSTAWIFIQSPYRQRMITLFTNTYASLKNNPEAIEARQYILRALQYIGNESCVPMLQKEAQGDDPRIRGEALQALRFITKKDTSFVIPKTTAKQSVAVDWKLYNKLSSHPKVEFETSKGKFTIELNKQAAPITVLSFVQLVQKKFYNGLTFHRVVPCFVIQGGDPRGDGWGGPGYTLHTEIYPLQFDEGSCGMASAGKDTEGSQFFITQVPVPHLDGRYTQFGKVVSGMDVVNTIMVGDKILSARVIQ